MNREERLKLDQAVDPVLFYRASDPYGFMSSFADYYITMPHPWLGPRDFTIYETREHYFQACKARDSSAHEKIRNASTPSLAKKLGKETLLRTDWGNDKGDMCWMVMVESIFAVVAQWPELAVALKETGDRVIYEDSPIDDIWGWRYRHDHSGKNLLGYAWMHVRGVLNARVI